MSKVPSPPSGARLLVVEDDDTIRDTVSEAMELEGFTVTAATNGQSAWDLLRRERFDLVVMDLMLPGMGGLDVCRQLRQHSNQTPILVVSARDTETDRVLGLEVGADDYLIKPFGMRELVARCRALLRRQRTPLPTTSSLEHLDLLLYPGECRVTRDGIDIRLSPKEYKLLELFMQNPRRVWSREQLLDRVWGRDIYVDTRTVDVHVGRLRKALTAHGHDDPIRTVRGAGYSLG